MKKVIKLKTYETELIQIIINPLVIKIHQKHWNHSANLRAITQAIQSIANQILVFDTYDKNVKTPTHHSLI